MSPALRSPILARPSTPACTAAIACVHRSTVPAHDLTHPLVNDVVNDLVNDLANHLASHRKNRMTDPFADPMAWRPIKAPSLDELHVIAEEAYRRLPDKFRALCEGLVIQVEDFPTDDVLDELKAETEFDLLGLFQGVGLPFQSESAPVQMPNMVWLYRVPILLYWAEHDETLGALVTHVLVHEIGHHFGLSDADMEAIEASVE